MQKERNSLRIGNIQMWGLGSSGGGHHHSHDDEIQQRLQRRADRQRQQAAAAAAVAMGRMDPSSVARASSVGSVGGYASSYDDAATANTGAYFNRNVYGNQWSSSTATSSGSPGPSPDMTAVQMELLQAEERQRRQLEMAMTANALHERQDERIRFEQHHQQPTSIGYDRDIEGGVSASARDQYGASIDPKRSLYERQGSQGAGRMRTLSGGGKSFDEDASEDSDVPISLGKKSILISDEGLHDLNGNDATNLSPSPQVTETPDLWHQTTPITSSKREMKPPESTKNVSKRGTKQSSDDATIRSSTSASAPASASSTRKRKGSSSKSPRKTSAKTPKRNTVTKRKSSTNNNVPDLKSAQPALHIHMPEITEEEYDNLNSLMTQFCKVPLLSEFSRPISLLHPELVPIYSKIIKHPMDLGKVCRAIRRKEYKNTRAICIDMWRIFGNCVKYHTHPLTREGAIVSFISIAMHLREYFNDLWFEYMVPSDIHTDKESCPIKIALQHVDEKRNKSRKQRLDYLSSTQLSPKFLVKVAGAIDTFIALGGRVDALDKERIDHDAESDSDAIASVFSELLDLKKKLLDLAKENSSLEYTVDMLQMNIRGCYSSDSFVGSVAMKLKFGRRLDRLIGKLLVPINEVVSRGVNQSSVWGCMAAAIWARESTKRPYWPSLVLGILAPEDQKEEWHNYLTKRNEARLPEKLRQELQAGRKKAEQCIRRQSTGHAERMSFFLVEFLGTHEFIWVREADIIENFDPDEDPNQLSSGVNRKKKASLRGKTPANEKMRQRAVEEGRWALEEFEEQLNDPCGDMIDDTVNVDDDEDNCSYAVLCASDDEADEADGGKEMKNIGHVELLDSNNVDYEEINELIATDGILDYSAEGRRHAKKRATAFKKQQADAKKEAAKREREEKARKAKKAKDEMAAKKKAAAAAKAKAKNSKAGKGSERKLGEDDSSSKHEEKELEKRRKKREREREKVMKEESRSKKAKVEQSSVKRVGRKLGIVDKRGRATAIVRGYLSTVAGPQDLRGLGLGGVLSIPAASVEGSGLLGLTLAFRAAAGELDMPNIKSTSSNAKPWEKIDTCNSKSSEIRCKKLEEQIQLLEESLRKLEESDMRRKKLIQDAIHEKQQADEDIAKAEKDARQNDMPKRKPYSVKKKDISKPN